MMNLNEKYKELIHQLKSISPIEKFDLAIILGSGLGKFASKIDIIRSVDTSDLINYPLSTVEGHAGKIHFCRYEDRNLLLFQGRIHFYEGYRIYESILPVFLSKVLGANNILLTNAAGGVNPDFSAGDLMLINSVISFNIKKELTDLIGLADINSKNNFINYPSKELNQKLKTASNNAGVFLKEGVYWYNTGPTYETPAEVNMARILGADAVGMSTAYEAVYASHIDMKVCAVSCITNMAAGISPVKLTHDEVTVTADLVAENFENLVKQFITLI